MNSWVALEPLSATVEAGAETIVWLRIRNTGDIVEEYHIDIAGDTRPWCAAEPATLRVYPGTTESVRLAFTPPRSPDAAAGPHPYGVHVRPVEVPDAVTVPEGNISVVPFTDLRAELLPVTARGWWHARPRLVVDNYGNTTVTAAVAAAAPGDRVNFDIRTPSLQVPPGRAHFSVLKLRPARLLWLGRRVSHPFSATVSPSGAEAVSVNGTYSQSALLPNWLTGLGVVLTGLLAALVGLWFLARPTVASQAIAAPAPSAAPVASLPHASRPQPGHLHQPAPGHRVPGQPAPGQPAPGQPAPGQQPTGKRPPRHRPPAPHHQKPPVALPAPAGWWKLNDGDRAVRAADTGGSSAATGFHAAWCASRKCATFTGSDSAFHTSKPVLNTAPGHSFTVAAWAYLRRKPGNGQPANVVSQDGTENSGFVLQYSAAGRRWAFTRTVANKAHAKHIRALSRTTHVLKIWTYLTGIFDAPHHQLRIYVDGSLQGTAIFDHSFPTAGSLIIGRAKYNGKLVGWFPGEISNVEVFGAPLSNAQVHHLYDIRRASKP